MHHGPQGLRVGMESKHRTERTRTVAHYTTGAWTRIHSGLYSCSAHMGTRAVQLIGTYIPPHFSSDSSRPDVSSVPHTVCAVSKLAS